MNEKELIKNLKRMKGIKPKSDWVSFSKKNILGEEPSVSIFSEIKSIFNSYVMIHKLASIMVLVFVSFSGIMAYAQNSLPGDNLYTLKKITEKVQFALKDSDQATLNFEVAERRLNDLDRVVKTNSSKNLAPAINEFQETVSEASKNVKVSEVKDIQTMSDKIEEIEERKDLIKSYGIEIADNKDLNDLKEGILCKKTKSLIEFTQTRSLTERQEELFIEANNLFQENKCQEAEKIILIDIENIDKILETEIETETEIEGENKEEKLETETEVEKAK